ncbi:MAG: DNA topoisomerase [Chloroflexia bacterium]
MTASSLYQEGRDEGQTDELDGKALPPLVQNEGLDLLQLVPEQHFTQPPPRFSEATLVKALEEQGIGRPSTYAPTLGTLQERYYMQRDGKQLRPTELGMLVNDLLVAHFPDIVSVGFTSHMEEELDEIASGEREWVPVIREFYSPFEQRVLLAETAMEEVHLQGRACGRAVPQLRAGDGDQDRQVRHSSRALASECRTTKPIVVHTGVTCPQCSEGELVERKTRKGRIFFACNRYPECDFTINQRPSLEPCPACRGLQVEVGRAGRGVPAATVRECCFPAREKPAPCRRAPDSYDGLRHSSH